LSFLPNYCHYFQIIAISNICHWPAKPYSTDKICYWRSTNIFCWTCFYSDDLKIDLPEIPQFNNPKNVCRPYILCKPQCGNALVFRTLSYKMRHDTTRASAVDIYILRHGLFGQLNTWGGGVESTHFGKRSLNPPQFHSRPTNSISYESWDIQLKFDTLLRLLRLKLGPREVAEEAWVQAKKNSIKMTKICNFWATQTLYTSKESWEQSLFIFETKSKTFVLKKLKKSQFRDFRSQKIVMSCRSRLNFWKTCQDGKKMTLPTFSWDVY
jgi:hypothetical protein